MRGTSEVIMLAASCTRLGQTSSIELLSVSSASFKERRYMQVDRDRLQKAGLTRGRDMASIKSASKVEMRRQTQIKLREAQLSDAEAAADLLRASITDLCIADHGNRARIIECWLANKTPHHVCTWITSPGRVVVAERQGRISGVGAAAASGEITLNYVLPIARFSGVSKFVLRDLEEYLRAEGHSVSILSSTRTAYQFYRAAGYVDAGEPKRWGELTAFPMIKHISSPALAGDQASVANHTGD